jgi:hypothetical protein
MACALLAEGPYALAADETASAGSMSGEAIGSVAADGSRNGGCVGPLATRLAQVRGVAAAADRLGSRIDSLAISAGANVKVVQTLPGHATAAMTLDRYGHLLSDDLAGVADALGKAIESVVVSLRYSDAETTAREDISAAS